MYDVLTGYIKFWFNWIATSDTILGVEYIYDMFFKIPSSIPSEINSFKYEYLKTTRVSKALRALLQ